MIMLILTKEIEKINKKFLDNIIDNKNKLIISQKEQFDLMSVCFAAENALKKNKKIN